MKANQSSTGELPLTEPRATADAPELHEILVPIDFSGSSVKALHRAAEMAADSHAHLTLVNVVDEPVSFRRLDVAHEQHQRRQQHESQMAELVRRELGADTTAETVVCEGDPAAEIARQAVEHHADLIVVGRHVHHGLHRLFHGHTASRVADTAPCPVMVLNDDSET